jgi:hypothetical protein
VKSNEFHRVESIDPQGLALQCHTLVKKVSGVFIRTIGHVVV